MKCAKHIATVCLVAVLAFSIFGLPGSSRADEVKVYLDGNMLGLDQSPIIEDGRALAPLRAIFEALGADVDWDGETRTVNAQKGQVEIELQIGSRTAYVNKQPVILDVPGRIVNDRTLVPLRFISEALGADVDWDDSTRTVLITRAPGPSVSDSNNQFGFNLYNQLKNGSQNIMISPISIAMALHMTYNGAGGGTKEDMAKALQVTGIDLDTLNQKNQDLLQRLKAADPKVKLEIANSLWLHKDMVFDQDFLKRNKDYYSAGAYNLDFGDPGAADTINNWVKENTKGLIKDIVDPPVDPMAIMFLINAVYFQGTWTEQFDPQATFEDTFHLASGGQAKVPMMNQSGAYDYYKAPDFQAIRLPYGKEKRMAMYIFLPDENSSLTDFQKELNYANWENWLSRFKTRQGAIMLPRFSLEYEKSLKDALSQLGMGIAFDPAGSDFSGMVPANTGDVHISDVRHKTFIEVDELGTEAAAVTSVEMRVTSMPLHDFNMKADRPFFYVIHDSETGAILFMGSVADPR
ncbi:MAG: Protease inhibitor precursor [Firmicutes bacterium ADurb.Bin456]|nr:MAG: Protease inhibitor precursor [Firmicutes bacterium ADurb.Bin456]